MKTFQLIVDNEADDLLGVNAISIVSAPAIEADFIALSKQQKETKFATINEDKRLLIGPALIPNKLIYRRRGEGENAFEFNVFMSEDTIRQVAHLYLKRGFQNRSTIEHMERIDGVTTVESWIIEDSEKDKSAMFGMNYPVGTWMVMQKVNNEEIWQNYVKTGEVNGFSIEGYFTEIEVPEMQMSKEVDIDKLILESLYELLNN